MQKNIAQKEELQLQILGANPVAEFTAVIKKMANLSELTSVETKAEGAASFMVGTTEFAVPLENMIDVEAEIARMEAELRCANEELLAMSETDGLTNLANRRKFDLAYESEWERALRLQQPMAVVIMDVDDFKQYNDRYGHQVGDACLRTLAHVLREHARRAMDVAARYGGEEFALILPGMTGAEAALLAEYGLLGS